MAANQRLAVCLAAVLMLGGCEALLGLIPDDVYEPNDTLEDAYLLTDQGVTEEVSGAVVTEIDKSDYFEFISPDSMASDQMDIYLMAAPDKPIRLHLLDENGDPLKTETSVSNGDDTTQLHLHYHVGKGKIYLLHVELVDPQEEEASSYGLRVDFD